MKIINSGFKELYNTNPQKHIEAIARVCYKSEDKIDYNDDTKRNKLLNSLYKSGHHAMLEHFIFIYEVPSRLYYRLKEQTVENSLRFFRFTFNRQTGKHIISFSARSVIDLYFKNINESPIIEDIKNLRDKVILDYNCFEIFGVDREETLKINDECKPLHTSELNRYERKIHGWRTIKFICDRGVSHEIVRHRDASFAQESTRYCNYSNDKFGNELTFIKPCFWDETSDEYKAWFSAVNFEESKYFNLLEMGAEPQEARSVLPNSLKTEIVMTARNDSWMHFFKLRCDNTAHPQMREIAIPIFNYFVVRDNSLFNRKTIKFTCKENEKMKQIRDASHKLTGSVSLIDGHIDSTERP